MADAVLITADEVLEAGAVLFGPGFRADAGWRERLRPVYRRRALETHPDRAPALGRGSAELAREFQRVAEAYRVLSSLPSGAELPRATRPRVERPASARASRAPAPSPARAARRGREVPARPPVRVAEPLPRRRLRFAEFLYYAGEVPWSALVDAIAWQRAQRPPLGRIAVDLGVLLREDVAAVLARRRAESAQATPFGQYAVRTGFMTPFARLAALGRQQRLQRRIGEFFVERGFLGASAVDDVRRRVLRHNVGFPVE